MNKLFIQILLLLILLSCRQLNSVHDDTSDELSDQIYQYSVFTALANKIYDGELTVGMLKEKGDLGLGTYNGLNGEMIVLNGSVYQFLANGNVREPGDSELVPLAVVTCFETDTLLKTNELLDYTRMKTLIEESLPSPNKGYAFRIEGTYGYIKCGSADKQVKPYSNTLSQALVNRPVFTWENIRGTLVGFWIPQYLDDINVPGFHLHFISEDETKAGHVLDFSADKLNISIDYCSGFNIELPETDDFKNAEFDLKQGYN
jgi:acetolactate decarboxylase